MRKWLLLVFALLMAQALAQPGQAEETKWWQYSYEGNVLPDQSDPRWVLTEPQVKAGMSLVHKVNDGILTMSHKGEGVSHYYVVGYVGSPAWRPDSDGGTTLEFRMRVTESVDSIPFASSLSLYGFGAEKNRAYTMFLGRKSCIFPGKALSLDMSQFHTFRITYSPVDKTFSLYVDGSATAEVVMPLEKFVPSVKLNRIALGGTFSKSMQGTLELDYIRWTNTAVIVPAGEAQKETETAPQVKKDAASAGAASPASASVPAASAPKPPAQKPPAASAQDSPIAARARHMVDTWDRWPLITVPKSGVQPHIDGTFDQNEWRDAGRFTGLMSYQTYHLQKYPSSFWLMHDGQSLYMAFQLDRPQRGEPKISASGYVAHLWNKDDGLEICLSADEDYKLISSIYCNGNSGYSQGLVVGGSFDTREFPISYKSRVTDKGIEGEMRIPLASLKELAVANNLNTVPLLQGKEWRFSPMRSDIFPEMERADWSKMWGTWYDGNRLGRLVFGGDAGYIRVNSIGSIDGNSVGMTGQVRNGRSTPMKLQLRYEIYQAVVDVRAKKIYLMDAWDMVERFRREGALVAGLAPEDQIGETGWLERIGKAYEPAGEGKTDIT
ncbi:MAG: hypothetical protein PHT33_12050, partial [bacterium]|nr:hypothetical protein [bacterium]